MIIFFAKEIFPIDIGVKFFLPSSKKKGNVQPHPLGGGICPKNYFSGKPNFLKVLDAFTLNCRYWILCNYLHQFPNSGSDSRINYKLVKGSEYGWLINQEVDLAF